MKKIRRKIKRSAEFSKVILISYAVACLLFIQENYLLAFLNRTEVNATVTISLITTVAASLLGYYTKSLLEKTSRNKYNLDENGLPFDKEE